MLRYEKGVLSEIPDDMPAEYPIKLTVNGREIATLVASPHELRFLVAGFLRTQGFVKETGDFLAMGVCDESGEASIRIRGEIPERLTPVLTSGCGTGISFSFNAGAPKCAPPEAAFSPEAIFAMMREMAQLSVRYGRHGGIHSAAASDGTRILLHAEDLGRHNTIDRLAGQALLSGIDLAGCLLLTSGRVSTEMAAKAASLGVALIASRTSPTDMAVRICREHGIGLVGYVRSDSFRIAACPERIQMAAQTRFTDVAGVILAGGESSRMGRNKALLEVNGERMIETAYRRMAELFDEVLLVTNTPEIYDFIPCRKIADIYPGMGPLGGIHAALTNAVAERAFITACDMPGLNPMLIRELCSIQGGVDVVIPETPGGLEPLHAVYAKSCLPKMEMMLQAGERRILSFFDLAQVRLVPRGRIAALDPDYASFRNINTQEDYRLLAKAD
ncbi:MAG: formate dehydrogenase accessory sulfurtransferase FdhD [Geobacteraceae bacterium]|nr:formate dehydrogenase accessory sulfurtransferase FdhD [Geobacteraceae bacterium]NTW81135.1 formate dehydrogenase accessory sulfurtransferase FdhD [Geobacteraceae bacterium]